MNMSKLEMLYKSLIVVAALSVASCASPGGESPGSEFMPDMYHSVAYEANVSDYYGFNTWGSEEEYRRFIQPRLPVKGSIPRGSNGKADNGSGIKVPGNGFKPYYYGDSEEERARASADIINNPYPISAHALEDGKELYGLYCGICHGEKADGNGYLVRDDGGVYPSQPTSFLTDDLINSSNGRYYHAIMFGKNVMGSYKDKLSYKERWDVIHYIRALQADSKSLKYNADVNELTSVEIPVNSLTEHKNTLIGHGHDASKPTH